MMQSPSHIHKNRGFTLMEALLGFLILSIGMLGIASLQAISLKSGKTSVYTSVAIMKSEELLESMRSNPAPAALAAYAAAGAGPGEDNGCSSGTACTPVSLASDDIFWWQNNLLAGLPDSVTTAVVYTPSPFSAGTGNSKLATMQVDINWDERDQDSGGSIAKTYTTVAEICETVPGQPC